MNSYEKILLDEAAIPPIYQQDFSTVLKPYVKMCISISLAEITAINGRM
ncbi:MAG: hypothetical protein ACE3JN_05630 [Ectobacillus sp.]